MPAAKTRTADRKKTARRKNPQKKTTRKVAQPFKKGVRRAVYDLYLISVVFLMMLMLSSAFLLYQWKDYKIVEYHKEIQQRRGDVLKLKSTVSRNHALVQSDLSKYHRIAEVAQQKLQLQPSVEEPVVLTVDKRKLEGYVQKDTAAEKP